VNAISKISQDGVSDTVTMVRQSLKSTKNNQLLLINLIYGYLLAFIDIHSFSVFYSVFLSSL
jgi:hypothetical protein